MTRLLFPAAVLALAAVFFGADRTEAEPKQTVFQHQACPDCIVMRVSYVPPKP